MMITRHNPRRSNDVTLGIGDGQDVTGLGTFATLIRHAITPLFRYGVAPIQVHIRHIKVILNGLKAHPPHLFKTTIPTPLLKVVVDRLPADFFFVWMLRIGTGRDLLPLATCMLAIQDIVEDFVQGNTRFITAFRLTQIRINIRFKLFFGYTRRDSAHLTPPLPRFLSFMMHYHLVI